MKVSITSFSLSFFLSPSPYLLSALPLLCVYLCLRFEPRAHSFAHPSLGQYPHH